MVLGLDGLDYEYIVFFQNNFHYWLELCYDNYYTQIDAYVAPKGVRYSGIPHTGPNWMSIYTGLPPEEHGIESEGWLQGQKIFNQVDKITIFDLIAEKCSQWIFNMPITWPLRPIKNTYAISGFPGIDDGRWYIPPDLKSDIPELYEVSPSYLKLRSYCQDPEKAIQNCLFKLKTFEQLYSKYETEVVFFGVTLLTDVLGHCKQMRLGYTWAEKLTKELVGFLQPDKLIICADHGMNDGQHRPGAFFLGPNPELPNDMADIAYYILDALDIDDAQLGKSQNLDRSEITLSEQRQIRDRLKALGYLG